MHLILVYKKWTIFAVGLSYFAKIHFIIYRYKIQSKHDVKQGNILTTEQLLKLLSWKEQIYFKFIQDQ